MGARRTKRKTARELSGRRPADEAEDLKRIFLSHYTGEEARIQTQVHERTGIWIVREAIAGRA